MAARYVPNGPAHGLSADALALDSERLTGEITVAEQLLGLAGRSLTGDDDIRARMAVARQVNLQVRNAINPDIIAESRGRQSVQYARSGGARISIDPTAASIVRELLSGPRGSTAHSNQAVW